MKAAGLLTTLLLACSSLFYSRGNGVLGRVAKAPGVLTAGASASQMAPGHLQGGNSEGSG